MDSEYGTGTNVEHPRRHKKANGNKYEVRNPLAESEDERENVRHPKIHQGIAVSGGMVAPAKRLKSLSSGSSSASDCSSEDFIQLDPKVINTRASATAPFPDHVRPLPIYYKTDLSSDASSKSDSRASATAPFPNHVRPLPIYYKTDLSSDASSKSERDSRLSTGDCSQVSGITRESLSYSPSVTESPPVQLMERPSGFDPNRIPPSVFARKTPSPMDWSVTSNESLFSIQIGNKSFSRDCVPKSTGELHKTGELETSRNPYTSDISFSPTPPVAQQKESERKKINLGRESEETEKEIIETPVATVYVQGKGNYPAQEMSFNHHSDRRELQIQTVVFPQSVPFSIFLY
ncbi:hypothetical protein Vadar_010854 [Vaccinium darrowii]|uniref:Uncharacterized protein n=1 Tax=Vaccinium darrowii TaxID=229202 RepID=A0ACB7XGS6_9ERIC|nr:hypothetical protein Vadar_010854 [Vaccinium darrowii]